MGKEGREKDRKEQGTDKEKGADRQKGKTIRWKTGKGMRRGIMALKEIKKYQTSTDQCDSANMAAIIFHRYILFKLFNLFVIYCLIFWYFIKLLYLLDLHVSFKGSIYWFYQDILSFKWC